MSDHRADLGALYGPYGVFPAGTAAKIITADNHVAGLAFLEKIRIQIFHAMSGQLGRIIGIQIPCWDNLIGIHVIAFINMCFGHN
jgi:hypothetical protein